MSDNNNADQGIPYSHSDDPGYSIEDFASLHPEVDDSVEYLYGSESYDSIVVSAESKGDDLSLRESDVLIVSSGDDFIGHTNSVRDSWSEEKEELFKIKLIDFVSSFHCGRPSLSRSNLLMGMAGEFELPFDHKLMDAVYELGDHKKIVGYPALVQFMNNLGYSGFAEPNLDPALDPTYDPGHITAEDVRRINERLPDEIKSDPEQMKRYRDNETATEISERLSESEISRDEVEGLIAKFNSKNSAIFYKIILDSVMSGEIPSGHYRYFDEHDPVSFAEGVIKESKGVISAEPKMAPYEQIKPQFESYSDEVLESHGNDLSMKNGFSPPSRKPSENGSAKNPESNHDRGNNGRSHSPGHPMMPHKPFDLTEAIAGVGMAVISSPFALMGGVGAIYNASAKGSYDKLLGSKISAMESSQASIKSTLDTLKAGVGSDGLPLREAEKASLNSSINENFKCYRNRIRDISDMSSSKHIDDESGKKIHDAMERAKAFADEMSKDDCEIAKKYKDIMENLIKVIDMIMRLFSSKKESGSPTPG